MVSLKPSQRGRFPIVSAHSAHQLLMLTSWNLSLPLRRYNQKTNLQILPAPHAGHFAIFLQAVRTIRDTALSNFQEADHRRTLRCKHLNSSSAKG